MYNEANYELDISISLNKKDSSNFNNKGNIYYEQGKYGEALNEFEKAILLNPDKFIIFLNSLSYCSPDATWS